MDIPVDRYIEGLLSSEAASRPSDSVKEEELVLELPPWYDKEKYENARKFYWNFSFAMATSMLVGLVAVFAIPSIMKVLVHSQRSSTLYTAYKRYLSTILHTVSWFENELTPGSTSWRSLEAVRRRHLRAGLSAKCKFDGCVSQRDLALTQFGFMGFVLLKPDSFGVRALRDCDWDAFNHFWKTIGYMVGIEDRYNVCRNTIEETREVCRILLERVYTPCLDNVPEYFEHMAKVLLEGTWSVNPTIDVKAVVYHCKYLAEVPGYLYTEQERMGFQEKLRARLAGQPSTTGIKSSSLIKESAIGLPTSSQPRLLYLHDYDVLESIPAYKSLTSGEKSKLNAGHFAMSLYKTDWGRWFYNANYVWSLVLMKYCPYLAFFRFGVRASYVNIFRESPKDPDATPKPNSFYYNRPKLPWYKSWIYFFWGEK